MPSRAILIFFHKAVHIAARCPAAVPISLVYSVGFLSQSLSFGSTSIMPRAWLVKSATPVHAFTLASAASAGGAMPSRATLMAVHSRVHSTASCAAAVIISLVSVTGFLSQSASFGNVSIIESAWLLKSATPAHAFTSASLSISGGAILASALAIVTHSAVHSTARTAAASFIGCVNVTGFLSQSASFVMLSIIPSAWPVKSLTLVHALTTASCSFVGAATLASAASIAYQSVVKSVASWPAAACICGVSVSGFLTHSASFVSASMILLRPLATDDAPSASCFAPSTAPFSSAAPIRPHSLTIMSAILANHSVRPRTQSPPAGRLARSFWLSTNTVSASTTPLTPLAADVMPSESAFAPATASRSSAPPTRPHSLTIIRAILAYHSVIVRKLSPVGNAAAVANSTARPSRNVVSVVTSALTPRLTASMPSASATAPATAPDARAFPMRPHSLTIISATLAYHAVIVVRLSVVGNSAAAAMSVERPSRNTVNVVTSADTPLLKASVPSLSAFAPPTAPAAKALPTRPHSSVIISATLAYHSVMRVSDAADENCAAVCISVRNPPMSVLSADTTAASPLLVASAPSASAFEPPTAPADRALPTRPHSSTRTRAKSARIAATPSTQRDMSVPPPVAPPMAVMSALLVATARSVLTLSSADFRPSAAALMPSLSRCAAATVFSFTPAPADANASNTSRPNSVRACATASICPRNRPPMASRNAQLKATSSISTTSLSVALIALVAAWMPVLSSCAALTLSSCTPPAAAANWSKMSRPRSISHWLIWSKSARLACTSSHKPEAYISHMALTALMTALIALPAAWMPVARSWLALTAFSSTPADAAAICS